MNFNSDISKIPIPSYPISGLNELIEDLPPAPQGQLHPLSHDNRHEAANRILATPDAALVSQIVDALSATPADSLNSLPAEVYGHRNLMPAQGGVNSSLSHVAQYSSSTPVVGNNSIQPNYCPDAVANPRVPSIYPGNINRPPVSRPVQAVAPQPRNPRLSEKSDAMERGSIVHEQKANHSQNIPFTEQAQSEENPKICLKIRRTKKNHKKVKHSTKHSSEYGIVSSENKPEGAGPIKLKLRLKPSGLGDSSKNNPSEQTFEVSSLTASDTSTHNDGSQQQEEDVASAIARAVFEDGDVMRHDSQEKRLHKSKSSKSEKRSHKHHHTHKHVTNSSHAGLPHHSHIPSSAAVQMNDAAHQQFASNQQQAIDQSMYRPPLSLSAAQRASTNQQNLQHFMQHGESSNHGNSSPAMQSTPSSQSAQMSRKFLSSHPDQQLHQKQFVDPKQMAQFNNSLHQGGTYPASSYNSVAQGWQSQTRAPNASAGVWADAQKHGMGMYPTPADMSDFGTRPPPYKEAMLAQQRAQHQLYQSLNQPLGPQLNKRQMTSQEQQLRQQQQMLSAQQQQQHMMQQMHRKHQEQQLHNQQQMLKQQQQQQHLPPQQQQQFLQQQQPMPVKPEVNSQSSVMMQQNLPQQVFQGTQMYQLPRPTSQNQMRQEHSHQQVPTQQQVISRQQQQSDPHTAQFYQSTGQRGDENRSRYSTYETGYLNTPRQSRIHHTSSNIPMKPKKKGSKQPGSQHLRVKFVADGEEADIFKLKDIMYPDDTEVSCFDDLQPGMDVVAKWPMNGKLYSAVVIDPLDTSGRRFRERKPPPKPFQLQPGGSRKDKRSLHDGPSVVLDKLAKSNLPPGLKITDSIPEDPDDGFNAYISMADRIKLKRRERLAKEASHKDGKKRKRDSMDPSRGNLINVDSDESDEEFKSPSRKRTHQEEQRKRERRRAAESRLLNEDGSGALQRVVSMIRSIFDDIDSVDPRLLDDGEKGGNVPQCLLISRSRLQELNGETAKLNRMDLLHQLPKKVLVRLLTILEPNIRNGVHLKPLKIKGNTPEEQKWNRECRLDRVSSATEAALTAMHIMTARWMPKAVYIDDVIEQAAQLLRQQLNNTIYPEYDLVYRTPTLNKKKGAKEPLNTASTRMKRAHYKGPKNRSILQLYNKLNILLDQMVELVSMQPLTDTSVLQISSLAVSPFFVENVRELQLNAIRLTTAVFSRYDKHRSLILEDIFQSLARLPTSKRNLRSYRLTYAEEAVDSSDDEDTSGGRRGSTGHVNNGELQHIQMVTALVLQMIHAITHLPIPDQEEESEDDRKIQHEVDELKVISSYDIAVRTGQNFLAVFLKKCASKSEEIDYRPLFENFVHDLLATVNKPEWPASEMLLSVLGRLLVHTFSTKSTEMSLRVASLDYLGVVAAKLRRDAVTSHTDVNTVKVILQRLEEASSSYQQPDELMEQDENKDESVKEIKHTHVVETEEDKLTQRLQYLLLGYLKKNADADPALIFAHNFYIGQWLRDVSQEFQQHQQHQEKGDAGEQLDAQSRALQTCQKKKDNLMDLTSSAAVAIARLTGQSVPEEDQKKRPIKINKLQQDADRLAAGLTVEDAALISRHLASTRPFSRAFDSYLSYILRIRDESAVALRTRAIKCLAEVVAVDPSIMERDDISQGVQASLMDASTSVREAAIDLVGKFIILKPDLVKHYYKMLTARILDTGVSVRKRVIRILRDLCHEYPDLPQLTDACVKMIRRVNDEEGIKKLVHEVFMKMWFTPVNAQDSESLRKKALLITDIVAANRERGYEWIEQLFKNLIDTPTRNPRVEEACRQIVDCLVQHVIIFENPQNKQNDSSNENGLSSNGESNSVSNNSATSKKNRSIRLVATVQTLVQLARIRPRLLVPHVMTLQPYLATKCETQDDLLTVHGVCRTLELSIPLMEHPSEAFLAAIEEDMMRMILTHRFHVISAAIACLGAITCSVTHNYRLIWDCFQRVCNGMSNARIMHQKNPDSIFQPKFLKQLLRTLFIIGHFSKNFDFDNENIKGKTQVCVKDKVYDCLYYFANLETTSITEELRGYSIAALGLLMVQDPNMMFRNTTRELYRTLLEPQQKSDRLKKQVLQNLQNYLQTEDVKMQEAAEASAKKMKEGNETDRDDVTRLNPDDSVTDDDIKEICDVSSGMASSVMQLFLKQVLESFFHRHLMVRHAALHTIYLTLQQGLVHPVQCVPYLIAASSDPAPDVHKEADQQLCELNKRYHGFVHTKALQGMRLAYRLQSYLQRPGSIVRGFYETSISGNIDDGSGTNLKASCSQLYQLVRSDRKHRRALLLSLLNLFDDTVKTNLEMLVFIADNLAYFPYHTLDEPLYLISQIEVYVSVSGSNVLQSFKESLQKKQSRKAAREERRAAKLRKKELKRSMEHDEESNDSDSSSSSSSSSSSESESSDDGDDSDDEECIESRLPVKDEVVEEFAHLSLACLLLLWLKQHLKTLFGFTDNKIHRYTPTELNRANDKQCHRRRADLRFNPKQALDHIDRMRRRMSCRDPEYIDAVVKQYSEFNELMNKLDPNDEDSDSDKEKKTTKNVAPNAAPSKEDVEMEESDRDTDGETKPTEALDVIRQSTALKSKKHSKHKSHDGEYDEKPGSSLEMRKRAPIQYLESSSDSEEEFRGF